MTNFKKYALAAAIVLPTLFTASNKAEASSAVKDANKANAVNVRSDASESNNIIGLITDDKSYEVLESTDGWLKIKFNGKEAYVGGQWFNITETAKILSPANFRKADNLNSEVYQVLKKDESVEVKSAANNGFVKVVFEGKEGYIHNSLLGLSNDFINKNYAPVQSQTSTNNNYQATASYQAPAQSYQAPAQTQAPAQNYTANNSSAKQIIAQRESGGSYNARNGQYIGKYQLSASYLNGDYSPANQERVADQYVAQRYGSWDNALAFWNNNGWY